MSQTSGPDDSWLRVTAGWHAEEESSQAEERRPTLTRRAVEDPDLDSQATVHHGRGATHILRPVWAQVRFHAILSTLWQAGNGSSACPECATARLLPRLWRGVFDRDVRVLLGVWRSTLREHPGQHGTSLLQLRTADSNCLLRVLLPLRGQGPLSVTVPHGVRGRVPSEGPGRSRSSSTRSSAEMFAIATRS